MSSDEIILDAEKNLAKKIGKDNLTTHSSNTVLENARKISLLNVFRNGVRTSCGTIPPECSVVDDYSVIAYTMFNYKTGIASGSYIGSRVMRSFLQLSMNGDVTKTYSLAFALGLHEGGHVKYSYFGSKMTKKTQLHHLINILDDGYLETKIVNSYLNTNMFNTVRNSMFGLTKKYIIPYYSEDISNEDILFQEYLLILFRQHLDETILKKNREDAIKKFGEEIINKVEEYCIVYHSLDLPKDYEKSLDIAIKILDLFKEEFGEEDINNNYDCGHCSNVDGESISIEELLNEIEKGNITIERIEVSEKEIKEKVDKHKKSIKDQKKSSNSEEDNQKSEDSFAERISITIKASDNYDKWMNVGRGGNSNILKEINDMVYSPKAKDLKKIIEDKMQQLRMESRVLKTKDNLSDGKIDIHQMIFKNILPLTNNKRINRKIKQIDKGVGVYGDLDEKEKIKKKENLSNRLLSKKQIIQIWDNNYHTLKIDEIRERADLVKVIIGCDISYSMEGYEDMLSNILWAIYAGCENIGVECYIFAWASSVSDLYRPGRSPLKKDMVHIRPSGGTDHDKALIKMKNIILKKESEQKENETVSKSYWLSIILTDGAWGRISNKDEADIDFINKKGSGHLIAFDDNDWLDIKRFEKYGFLKTTIVKSLEEFGNYVKNELFNILEKDILKFL